MRKISGTLHSQALRRQYGGNYISAMPSNRYGPGDNFHPTTRTSLHSLIRRFHEGKGNGAPAVTV